MKLLFLRGAVPRDRDPCQIMFDKLKECDDVWTQLARNLSLDGYGEVWYWGGKRTVNYAENFIERWLPTYNIEPSFTPDVIFARGGFPEYDVVMQKYPNAFKIYYGAGKRFVPQHKFRKYNLIIVDTPQQLAKVRKVCPDSRSELFIKPAADNIFKPVKREKKYDVIFSANAHKAGIKGHDFFLPNCPVDLKAIQVGQLSSNKIRKQYPHIEFTDRVPRCKLPEYYGQSKVAVVCCTNRDSCPRVIPEALACDCPLLILDSTNLWNEKYITPQTGCIASSENFMLKLRDMVKNYKDFSAYNYYKDNLSLSVAAEYIKGMIS